MDENYDTFSFPNNSDDMYEAFVETKVPPLPPAPPVPPVPPVPPRKGQLPPLLIAEDEYEDFNAVQPIAEDEYEDFNAVQPKLFQGVPISQRAQHPLPDIPKRAPPPIPDGSQKPMPGIPLIQVDSNMLSAIRRKLKVVDSHPQTESAKFPIRPDVLPQTPIRPDMQPKAPIRPDMQPKAPIRPDMQPKTTIRPDVQPRTPIRPDVTPKPPVPSSKPTIAKKPELQVKPLSIPVTKRSSPIPEKIAASQDSTDGRKKLTPTNSFSKTNVATPPSRVSSGAASWTSGNSATPPLRVSSGAASWTSGNSQDLSEEEECDSPGVYADTADLESLFYKPYYYETFNQSMENEIFHENTEKGTFVIRKSRAKNNKSNESHPYTILIYYGTRVFRLKIRFEDDEYAIGEKKDNEVRFTSVTQLVEHYTQTPLMLIGAGFVTLKYP